jgi:hypothetical protein
MKVTDLPNRSPHQLGACVRCSFSHDRKGTNAQTPPGASPDGVHVGAVCLGVQRNSSTRSKRRAATQPDSLTLSSIAGSALGIALIAQNGEGDAVGQPAQEADPKRRHHQPGQENHASKPEGPKGIVTCLGLCPVTGHLFRFSTHVDDPCEAASGGRTSHAGLVVRSWAAVRRLGMKTPPGWGPDGGDGSYAGLDLPPVLEGSVCSLGATKKPEACSRRSFSPAVILASSETEHASRNGPARLSSSSQTPPGVV